MKYFKRSNMYKASNVTVNAETLEARSYEWWIFVKRIKGKLVFNDYGYSNTTRRHQWKVRRLLKDTMHVNIDHVIEAPKGLQRLDLAIEHYNNKIADLQAEINKRGTKKKKNEERAELINQYQERIILIQDLMKVGV